MHYEKLKRLWNEMVINAEKIQRTNAYIIVNKDRYFLFEKIFLEKYDDVKKIMASSVKYLDRHKVAAIIVYSILKTNFLEYSADNKDKQFILPYQFAFSAGLSYMQYEYNHELIEAGKKPIECFNFPPTVCGDNYLNHMIRFLFYEDKRNEMNIISLSNIFFLLKHLINLNLNHPHNSN